MSNFQNWLRRFRSQEAAGESVDAAIESSARTPDPHGESAGVDVRLEDASDAEWRVEDREIHLRSLLNAHVDLIVRHDADGRLTFVNQAVCDRFSVEPDAVLGTNYLRRSRPVSALDDDVSTARASTLDDKLDLALSDTGAVERLETVDGPRWIAWTATQVQSADGVVETLSVGRDVTGLREMIDRLERARDEAHAANRAKSRFLAAMSHEIRTPMNGILGVAALLSTAGNTEERETYIDTIQQSTRQLVSLVDEILDFSAIEAGKLKIVPSAFSVRAHVANITNLFGQKAIEKSLELRVTVAPGVPVQLIADEMRLRQVVINLVSNAIKFTDRGFVEIGVNCEFERDLQRPHLAISVRDSGPGLSPVECKNVFAEFSRGDQLISTGEVGTGLGLAISKRLAIAMGGDLSVSSDPGAGSIFTLRVPVDVASTQSHEHGNAQDSAEAGASSAAPSKRNRGSKADRLSSHFADRPRVLIAEDNPVNLLLAERIISRLGCEVVAAKTGIEAVAIVRAARAGEIAPIDLILMDVLMPEMDGLEAVREIRRLERAQPSIHDPLPIIGLTANAYHEDREACEAAGMNDYLAKPFDPDQLTDRVMRLLADAAASPNGAMRN